MYVDVEIQVTDYEKLKEVFRSALVEEFKQQTGILYKEDVLKLHLFFEEDPAQATIFSMCECGKITYLEYNYPNTNENDSKEERKTEVSTSPQNTEITENEGKSVPGKTHEKEVATCPQKSRHEDNTVKTELEKLSENVSSADEYINKVADFLGIPDKQKPIFAGLVAIYADVKKESKATWENLIIALEKHWIKCNSYDKKLMIDAVTEKLNIKFLKVVSMLSEILGKINFDDIPKENEQEAKNPEETDNSDSTEEDQKSQNAQEEPLRKTATEENQEKLFHCMPDHIAGEPKSEELMKLEEQIRSINKELPMEEKIKQAATILAKAQGLSFMQSDENMEIFIRLTQRAMGSRENVTFDKEVINPEGLPEKQIRIFILSWSTITMNIKKMYNPDYSVEIKAIDFLEDLREILK